MANFRPGAEPKELQIKLDRLFAKLNEYYPDKVVVGLHNDHKKLGERITAMYRALGYPDYHSFLVAYGYCIEQKASGRKKTVDPQNVIAELQRRYPDGSPFWKLSDLFAGNPDLAKNAQTLTNTAPAVFGMSLADYLRSIGILSKSDGEKFTKEEIAAIAVAKSAHSDVPKMPPDECIAELKRRYPNGSPFGTIDELFTSNPDLLAGRKSLEKSAYAMFGQTLARYLKEIGILRKSSHPRSDDDCRKAAQDHWDTKRNTLVLSKDGKTVIDATCRRISGDLVIPDGVETIAHRALYGVSFSGLVINKELKSMGEGTLFHPNGTPRSLQVRVAEGNPNIRANEDALFCRLPDGKWRLEYFKNTKLTCYKVPNDVEEIRREAILACTELRELHLGRNCKVFDEAWLSRNPMQVVYLPQSVENVFLLRASERDVDCAPTKYTVDKENKTLFIDEDCLYQVLSDGTFRLVRCNYGGDLVTVLDGTSEIGPDAFAFCGGALYVKLPDSLRIIGDEAFYASGLKEIRVPKSVTQIRTQAFAQCESLRRAVLPDELERLDGDVFDGAEIYEPMEGENDDIEGDGFFNLIKVDSYTRGSYHLQNGVLFCGDTPSEEQKRPNMQIIAQKLRVVGGANVEYDAASNSVSMDFMLRQTGTYSLRIEKTWVEASLECHTGDAVQWRLGAEDWLSCISSTGKVIGTLDWDYSEVLAPYYERLSFTDGYITSLEKPWERRGNAKYPKIQVHLCIYEQRPAPEGSEAAIWQQYSYLVQPTGVELLRWLNPKKAEKLVIPDYIEGKPVVRIRESFLAALPWRNSPQYTLKELILPKTLQRIDAGAFYDTHNSFDFSANRITFPAGLSSIDPGFLKGGLQAQIEFETGWVNQKTVFEVPKGSYAAHFLSSYQTQRGDYYKPKLVFTETAADIQEKPEKEDAKRVT